MKKIFFNPLGPRDFLILSKHAKKQKSEFFNSGLTELPFFVSYRGTYNLYKERRNIKPPIPHLIYIQLSF